MKQIILFLSLCLILFSFRNDDYQMARNGVLYKIIPGKNIKDSILKLGTLVTYSLVEKFGDSIGSNTYNLGHQSDIVDSITNSPLAWTFVVAKMRVGDSALIKLSTDSIYNIALKRAKQNLTFKEEEFKKTLPVFFQKKGEFIELGIRVLDNYEINPANPKYKADSARFVTFMKAQQEVALAYQKKQNDDNMAAGKIFLDSNKTKKDIITTASGLQYQELTKGTGAKPTINDVVKVHYVGTTLDGFEFDNSIKNGEPAMFEVNRVVHGWTEALQLMNTGSKYKVWIPGNLGYGERGNPDGGIQPGKLLVFEMELLEVIKGKKRIKNTVNKKTNKKIKTKK